MAVTSPWLLEYTPARRVIERTPWFQSDLFCFKLLLKSKGVPSTYKDLMTVNGVEYASFRAAAEASHLLANEKDMHNAMKEASIFSSPHALRHHYVMILVHSPPIFPKMLWCEFRHELFADFVDQNARETYMLALQAINDKIQEMGRDSAEFDLIEP